MNKIKKLFVYTLTLSFVFTDMVFAAKSNSKKGKRAASASKASKPSSKKGNGKRAAANAKTSAGTRNATIVSSVSAMETKTTTTNPKDATSCRSAYSQCMDIQISGILNKYNYLAEDPAVEAIQDTGTPLRCVYYSAAKNENSDVIGQLSAKHDYIKEINSLYYAYNYYCTPIVGTGASNQPANKCQFDTSKKTTVATEKSYAFYKEAYDRITNREDDFVLLNFESTNLFKNKLSAYSMGTDYSVKTSDVSDMLIELGLDTAVSYVKDENGNDTDQVSNSKLFSVTVTPPVGAGTLNPAGVFAQAHSICMGEAEVPETAVSGLSAKETENLKKVVSTMSSCTSQESSLQEYYLTGKWYGCEKDEDGTVYNYANNAGTRTCVAEDGTEDSSKLKSNDTGFLTPQSSCESYETALMASRDGMFAKFQDKMTNYLSSNIAKLIKNELKKQSEIATSIAGMKTADSELLKAEAEANKVLAQTKKDKAMADAELAKAEAEAKALAKQADADAKVLLAETDIKVAETEASAIEKEKILVQKELANATEKELKDKISQVTGKTDFGESGKKYTEKSGSISLGSAEGNDGCYDISLSGAGGGAGQSVFMSFGKNGGNGGKFDFRICVQSGTLNIDYKVGVGGSSCGGKGGDTSITLASTGAVITGAKLGATYTAFGGEGGAKGKAGWTNKSSMDGAGCSAGEGTCHKGDGASGGSVTALKCGDDGKRGSIQVSNTK